MAGSILAPGVSTFIPGTTLHNDALQSRANNAIGRDQSAIQTQQQGLKDQADLTHTQAETAAIPINAGIKQQAASASLAQHGLKVEVDENGMTHVVPDEESPVYQQQQQKEETLKAQAAYMQAGTELRAAQAAFNKAKTDPNSPLFQQTSQRLAVAQQNANAAGERAKAYMGRYMQSAYNVGLNGDVLQGAPVISDDNGGQAVVGTGNAAQATKAQSNVGMFNEVENATSSMRKTAAKLVQSGGKLNSPTVAAAIADPKTTSGQWLQGAVANSNLTPAERDYVIAVKAYKERLQPLRKSAGGGVSDSQVDRLMTLAPSAATPDPDYLNRQLDQIDQLRTNLAKGVTTATGGLKVRGQGNPYAPPKAGPQTSGVSVTDPGGTVHTFPNQAAANAFKKAAGF